MNIITELNKKITTHLTTCMDKAFEEESGLTGMIESTLTLVREMGRDMMVEMIGSREESLFCNEDRQSGVCREQALAHQNEQG